VEVSGMYVTAVRLRFVSHYLFSVAYVCMNCDKIIIELEILFDCLTKSQLNISYIFFVQGVSEPSDGGPRIAWAVMRPVDCYESMNPGLGCYEPR